MYAEVAAGVGLQSHARVQRIQRKWKPLGFRKLGERKRQLQRGHGVTKDQEDNYKGQEQVLGPRSLVVIASRHNEGVCPCSLVRCFTLCPRA